MKKELALGTAISANVNRRNVLNKIGGGLAGAATVCSIGPLLTFASDAAHAQTFTTPTGARIWSKQKGRTDIAGSLRYSNFVVYYNRASGDSVVYEAFEQRITEKQIFASSGFFYWKVISDTYELLYKSVRTGGSYTLYDGGGKQLLAFSAAVIAQGGPGCRRRLMTHGAPAGSTDYGLTWASRLGFAAQSVGYRKWKLNGVTYYLFLRRSSGADNGMLNSRLLASDDTDDRAAINSLMRAFNNYNNAVNSLASFVASAPVMALGTIQVVGETTVTRTVSTVAGCAMAFSALGAAGYNAWALWDTVAGTLRAYETELETIAAPLAAVSDTTDCT